MKKLVLAGSLVLGGILVPLLNSDDTEVVEVVKVVTVEAAEKVDYDSFHLEQRVSSETVIKLIEHAHTNKLAVFVHTKADDGIVVNYGHRLGGGLDMHFTSGQVFRGNTPEESNTLNFVTRPDLTSIEAKFNLYRLRVAGGASITSRAIELDQPLISVVGSDLEDSVQTGYFYTEQELTDVITQAEEFLSIPENGRFLSTLVKNAKGETVAIYFEEYGSSTHFAPLANLLYARGEVETIGGDGVELK